MSKSLDFRNIPDTMTHMICNVFNSSLSASKKNMF